MQPNYIVTLVHGTWARGAAWTQPHSVLCKTLRKHLNSSVEIHCFEWSGRNSHVSRLRVAEELEAHLRNLIAAYPKARHFVIGHSHGGNIALYALRNVALQQKMNGVVCLSTPFLSFKPRNIGRFGTASMETFLVSFIFFPGAILLWINIDRIPQMLADVALLSWALISGALGLFLFRRWAASAECLRKRLLLPNVDATHVFVVRASADEASFALQTSEFISWLSTKVWSVINDSAHKWESAVEKRLPSYCGPLAKLSLLLCLIGLILVVGGIGSLGAVVFVIGGMTVGAMVLIATGYFYLEILSLALLPGLALFLGILQIPFGRETVLTSLFFDVTPEASPSGTCTVFHIPEHERQAIECYQDEVGGLMHSVSYEDPQALEAIVRWMRQMSN